MGGAGLRTVVEDEVLVVVRRVVGARHHHAPHPRLRRRLEDVEGHLHVRVLRAEEGVVCAVRAAAAVAVVAGAGGGGGGARGGRDEAHVHHGVRALEEGPDGLARPEQVAGLDAVALPQVERAQLVALAQGVDDERGDGAGGAGEHHHGLGGHRAGGRDSVIPLLLLAHAR